MSVPIEFRVGEVDGTKLIRSIYGDLVNLPDPVRLGLTVRIFNYDDVVLYMRVDGYATGWTFTSNDLGSLASGANMYRNLDQFGQRAKPPAETFETITVRLRAYTDAGYSDLKWTFERVIDVVFIKSDDGSWTQDFLNNFDDGTVQGWAVSNETGAGSTYIEVMADYVLSAPFSIRLRHRLPISAYQAACFMYAENRERLYKSFNTPDRDTIFAIFDIRPMRVGSGGIIPYVKYLSISVNDVAQVYLGRPVDATQVNYYPTEKWFRVMIPLPRNTTVDLRITIAWRAHNSTGSSSGYAEVQVYLDDFRIISK